MIGQYTHLPRSINHTRRTSTNANASANASVNASNKKLFTFLSLHLRSLPALVYRQKLNHYRPSWKNTSTALAYLSLLAFALDVWTRLHFHLRLRLHLDRTCEPWNDLIIYNYRAEYVFNVTVGNVAFMLSRSVFISRRSSYLHKKLTNKIKICVLDSFENKKKA